VGCGYLDCKCGLALLHHADVRRTGRLPHARGNHRTAQRWDTRFVKPSRHVNLILLHLHDCDHNLLTDTAKVAPNSTWNAHKSASPHPAPTPAPILSASPAHTPPVTPASRSASTTPRASRTWAVRATRSLGRRRWCAVVRIMETEEAQRLRRLLRPRLSRRTAQRRVCTRSVVERDGRDRLFARRELVPRVGSTIRSACRRGSDSRGLAESSCGVYLSTILRP